MYNFSFKEINGSVTKLFDIRIVRLMALSWGFKNKDIHYHASIKCKIWEY